MSVPSLLARRLGASSLRAASKPLSRHSLGMRRSMATEAPAGIAGPCFQLNEDQEAYRDLARRFTEDHIIPNAKHHDQTMEYPWEIIKAAHAAGLVNTHIPEAYGGPGLGIMEGALVSEELAFGCTGIQTAIEANGLAEAPLLVAGSEETKKKYLGRMTEEPLMASYCVTEPGAGSDVASITTRAEKVGDKWILNGTKMWITNGGHANWYFVLAKTDPKAKPGKSMTGFVVDGDSPGIIKGKKEINMGQRCSDTRMITFENVEVPDANVLGKPGDGFKTAMGAFDITRPLIAAASVGLANRALTEAAKWAHERKTFGQAIFGHQAVAFMIADMAIKVEAARNLTWKASSLKDQGQRNSYQAAIAKAYASEAANANAYAACQVYGGMGFNTELSLYEGTSEIQRLIISRHVAEMFKP